MPDTLPALTVRKGVDGSECDWGTGLVYEPPSRVVLSWHLNGQWEYDPDPSHASEVDVRFIPAHPLTCSPAYLPACEAISLSVRLLRDSVLL